MPPEIRFSLGAFFLVIGGVAVYQKLKPVSVGGKETLEETDASLTADGRPRAAHLVLWVVSVMYITIAAAFTIMFPEKAALSTGRLAQWAGQLLDAGRLADVRVESLTGPLPPAASPWTWVLMLLPLVFAAVSYGIVRLKGAGHHRTALAAACVSMLVVLFLTPFASATLRVITGDAYREELTDWLDEVTPAQPAAMWGKEGPVIMQGNVSQYQEVEPAILYRRWTRISEAGEASQTEIIYPFRMGPFTIGVGEGKDYQVVGVGVQSSERVIMVNESLKVAGYLSGGALEARPGMPIMIMPSSFPEWRETLVKAWVKPSLESKVLVFVAVACESYILLTLAALLILFIVRSGPNSVKTSGEEKQPWPDQPKT